MPYRKTTSCVSHQIGQARAKLMLAGKEVERGMD